MVRVLYTTKVDFFLNDKLKRYRVVLVVEESGRTHRINLWPDFLDDVYKQISRIEGEGYHPLTQAERTKWDLERAR